MYTIYKITNLANGKVYIGKTSLDPTVRFHAHLKSARVSRPKCAIHKAIKKHGVSLFELTSLETTVDAKRINDLEQHFIKEFDCCILDGPDKGYNMTRGGDGFDSETVRQNNLKRVADGAHPWAGVRGSKLNKQTQQSRIKAGTFHFQGEAGSKHARSLLEKRTALGTNAWAGELGSRHSKAVAARLLAEGKHHSQQKLQCPHCFKVGAGNALKRWHFNNCRSKLSDDLRSR